MHTTHHAETKIEHSPLQAQGEHDSEPKGRPHSQLLTEKYVCTVEVATAHCKANPPAVVIDRFDCRPVVRTLGPSPRVL